MSRYNEYFVCRVCGNGEYHTIVAYGDYDGPDEPRELKNCVRCQTLNETVPKIHERMKAMAKQISDLKYENEICKETNWRFRREFLVDFGNGKAMKHSVFLDFEKKLDTIMKDAQTKLKKTI